MGAGGTPTGSANTKHFAFKSTGQANVHISLYRPYFHMIYEKGLILFEQNKNTIGFSSNATVWLIVLVEIAYQIRIPYFP